MLRLLSHITMIIPPIVPYGLYHLFIIGVLMRFKLPIAMVSILMLIPWDWSLMAPYVFPWYFTILVPKLMSIIMLLSAFGRMSISKFYTLFSPLCMRFNLTFNTTMIAVSPHMFIICSVYISFSLTFLLLPIIPKFFLYMLRCFTFSLKAWRSVTS